MLHKSSRSRFTHCLRLVLFLLTTYIPTAYEHVTVFAQPM